MIRNLNLTCKHKFLFLQWNIIIASQKNIIFVFNGIKRFSHDKIWQITLIYESAI